MSEEGVPSSGQKWDISRPQTQQVTCLKIESSEEIMNLGDVISLVSILAKESGEKWGISRPQILNVTGLMVESSEEIMNQVAWYRCYLLSIYFCERKR